MIFFNNLGVDYLKKEDTKEAFFQNNNLNEAHICLSRIKEIYTDLNQYVNDNFL